jgi:hypothetical protein
MKSAFLLAFAALFLIAPAEAAKQGNNKAGQKAAEAKKKEKEADRADRAKKREGVDAVLEVKDKNKDGSLDPDEYLIGESDVEAAKARFKQFNKNGDRYMSKREIQDSLGL